MILEDDDHDRCAWRDLEFEHRIRIALQSTAHVKGALTAVSLLFRRHNDGSSLSSGQGDVEGKTRKRSEVVPGCRGCRRFVIVERTIKLGGVRAQFRPNPIGTLATG